jgi:hypothetical protein
MPNAENKFALPVYIRKETHMATLTSLKLVAAKKSAIINPVQHRRLKISAKIQEQIALATALQAGDTYVPTRTKITTNAEGERVQVTEPKRIKAWWFTDGNKVFLQIRYGAKVVALNGKSNAIECTTPESLLTALTTVHEAVMAGELDGPIEAISGQIRGGFQR